MVITEETAMISDERLEMISKYDTFVSLGETEAMAKELLTLRKSNQWVSVDDGLPKKGSKVLIFIDFNSKSVPPSIHDAEFTGSTFRRGAATVKPFPLEDGFGVTHWLPLPESPC